MASAVCDVLGFAIYIFLVLVILFTLLYFLWIKKKFENVLSYRHAGTIVINGTLWFWSIYCVLAELICSNGMYTHYNGLTFLFIFLVVVTLADVYFSPELSYFMGLKSGEDMVAYFDKVKQTSPYLRFHIECYHEVWVKTQNARGGKKGRWEKVVSFTAQSDYPYITYQDQTDYPDISASFQENPVLAYHMENIAGPGDQFTVRNVAGYKEKLVEGCRGRDTKITCKTETNIPETQDRITSIKTEEKPFWFSLYFYLVSVLFSINGIVRVKFQLLSRPRKLVIKKMMFADPRKVIEYNLQGTGSIDTTMIISHVDPNAIPQVQMGMGPMIQGAQQEGTIYPGQVPIQPGGFPTQPNVMVHAQPGYYPPAQSAGYPSALPGSYPPAQSGGYPPAQPGGYPSTQPGGYPPAQQSGYPIAPVGYPGSPNQGLQPYNVPSQGISRPSSPAYSSGQAEKS